MLRRKSAIALLAVILLFWPALAINAPVSPMGESPHEVIRFAVFDDIYPTMSRRDVRFSLETIMQKVIDQKTYPYVVQINMLDHVVDDIERIRQGQYHFVVLSGLDYLIHRTAMQLTPVLMPSKGHQPTETLLLLVRKGCTLASIAQKEEPTLVIEDGRNGDLSQLWLDAQLAARDLPDTDRLFTTIRRVNKPNRAVLPVFFNQADACIVTRNSREVMIELNPQIGKQVHALIRSKGLVRSIICATPRATDKEIDILVRESLNFQRNPETQQALTIIQMKQFHPVSQAGIDATKALFASTRYNTEGAVSP